MDGTLTIPAIDFAEMRRRIGVLEGDILSAVASWPDPARRARAHAIIEEVEMDGLARLELAPGLHNVLSSLDRHGLPRALVTRNNSRAVHAFHAHLHAVASARPFIPALAREFHPPKPDPAALHHCAETWGVCPTELVMIGDSLADDVVAGNRAGTHTILIDHDGVHDSTAALPPEQRPTAVATSLAHAGELLEAMFHLKPGM
jgi:HAD superfamily hydrolase (TIGR01509 family)